MLVSSGCHNKIHYLVCTDSCIHSFSHSSGGRMSKIKVPRGLVLGDTFPLGLKTAPAQCVLTSLFSVETQDWGLRCLSHFFLIHQSYQFRAPHLGCHLTLTTSLRVLSPNKITLGVRIQTHKFRD